MKCRILISALSVFLLAQLTACADEPFVPIFDGKTFEGWTVSKENPDSFVIEDGAFVTRGPRAHLFYTGALAPFKNFELKMEVMTEPGSNGGIYFHTAYQETNWPRIGFESQVNVSHSDWKKTGSLYDLVNIGYNHVQDNVWWTQHIIVNGRSVTVRLNDVTVLQYIEPEGAQPGHFTRKLDEGTFGLQCHDPKSVVHYRNIHVKRLPD